MHRYLVSFSEIRVKIWETTFFSYFLEEGQRAQCLCSGGHKYLQPVAHGIMKLLLEILDHITLS